MIRSVETDSDRRWLRWLDGECFPDDKPLRFDDAKEWALAWNGGDAVAFCGWRPHGPFGFLSRAGVLPSARGRGLQKAMIDHREQAIRSTGLSVSVTYTEAYSAASMRSLIACGYRPFEGSESTGLVINPAYWRTMVYWRKEL